MKLFRKIFKNSPNSELDASHLPPQKLSNGEQDYRKNSSIEKIETDATDPSLNQNSKDISQISETFNFLVEASLLQEKMLKINKTVDEEEKVELDLGLIIGIIDGKEDLQDLVPDECFKVRIGPQEEINSLTAIREGSMDSLLIFFNQDNFNNLYDILHSRQRLLFVMQNWRDVQYCVHNIEKILLETCGQRPLSQYSYRILSTLTSHENRFFLSFQSEHDFWCHFQSIVHQKLNNNFDTSQLQCLAKMMTLEQYYQLKNNSEVLPCLKKKFEIYRIAIDQEVQQMRKREEIEKIKLMLAEEEQKQNEQSSEVEQQEVKSDIVDLEVQYFRQMESQIDKMESQIETGESNSKVDYQDLYYFIEEHDNSGSEEEEDNGRNSNKQPATSSVPKLARIMSCHSLTESAEQELDDEFFTKY